MFAHPSPKEFSAHAAQHHHGSHVIILILYFCKEEKGMAEDQGTAL
jgi:hypothetical protein